MVFKLNALTAIGQSVCFATLLTGCGSSSSSGTASAAAIAAATPATTATTSTAPATPATTTTTAATPATTTTNTTATAPATPAATTTTAATPAKLATTTTAATTTPATTTTAAATPAKPATTTTAATTTAPAKPATTATQTAPTPAVVTNVAAGPLTATNSGDACLPTTMPTTDAVFNSSKKIFAHYFDPFPLSIDNKAPNVDYYNTNYLNKNGESNKWVSEGGYLRQRPLGVNASSNPNWAQLNMQHEVSTAIARGITGFVFDVMGLSEVTNANSRLNLMLKAAQAVDSRFKIVVMPDMTVFGSDSNAVVEIIAAVAKSPAAYRLSDGRLVVSPFDTNLDSASWWASVLNRLKAQGINVAFVPTFLGWTHYADLFASISYGFADWGTATAGGSALFEPDPTIVHDSFHKIFMTPVGSQQYRPKDFIYWEAGNSASLRSGWTSSIAGNADWVQIVTWNDYSESGQVSPYTDTTLQRSIGTGYYDLSGYYASWFLTGRQPAITHDVLYWFYRREPSTARITAQSKPDSVIGGVAENDIELVAFLTAPGELKITIGGKTYTHNATTAGMVSFKVPTQPGVPLFTLSRNGADVFSFNGGVQIYGAGGIPSGVADMTYWSGSAAKSGVCSL